MIRNELTSCIKKIDTYKKRKHNADKTEAKINRDTRFINNSQAFIGILNRYFVANSNSGFIGSDDIIANITEAAEILKKGFAADEITEDILRGLETKIGFIEKNIAIEWNRYAKEKASASVNMMNLLSALRLEDVDFFQLKNNITTYYDFNKLANQTRVNLYNKAIEDITNLTAKLRINADVQSFLEKIQLNQATLLDVTDEVRGWITDNNLQNNFILSIR